MTSVRPLIRWGNRNIDTRYVTACGRWKLTRHFGGWWIETAATGDTAQLDWLHSQDLDGRVFPTLKDAVAALEAHLAISAAPAPVRSSSVTWIATADPDKWVSDCGSFLLDWWPGRREYRLHERGRQETIALCSTRRAASFSAAVVRP